MSIPNHKKNACDAAAKGAAIAWRALSAVALLVGIIAIIEPALAAPVELHGAGSTFVAPLLKAWIDRFDMVQEGTSIKYDVVGSGEGVARFKAGTVDFGASDTVIPVVEAEKVQRGVVQVPSTAGMIVLAYNLPGVKGQLRLPQDVYVDIFLGKIRSWRDARIVAANHGLNLPSTDIAVIVRQDSSGTTYAFTDHLSAASKSWSNGGPGVGMLVDWPHVSMQVRGNEGVASRIKISEGSIGYVEYGFALRLGLPMAVLQNKDGQFVAPTPQSGAAGLAASSAGVGLDALDESTTKPSGPKSYPIVTYSWLLLYRSYTAEQTQSLTSFVDYVLDDGQSYAPYSGYLALPPSVVQLGKAALAKVQ